MLGVGWMGGLEGGVLSADNGWEIDPHSLLGNDVRLVELSEQQKKEMFLKAREDLFPVPSPPPSQQPPRDLSESSNQKKKEESPTPRKKKSSQSVKKATSKTKTTNDKQQKGVKKKPSKSPRENDSPSEGPSETQAPIHIVKSGQQEDMGLVPPPGRGNRKSLLRRYRYLTPAVRWAIDRAPVRRGRWKYIIVHNSGTRQGNARIFDIYHRRVRHMQNGLAYHFVIGNGTSSGNGQIEVGDRWKRQINGGHVASDYLNNIAIGICLVGDYNRTLPTPQQIAALEELIPYLQARSGRYRGRFPIVLGHREINPKPTDCPGRRFPLRWLHQKFPNR